jgi:hypothetical protein
MADHDAAGGFYRSRDGLGVGPRAQAGLIAGQLHRRNPVTGRCQCLASG